VAERSFRKVAEREAAGLDSFEPDDRASHMVEHPPDLALSSFVDRDFHPGVRFLFPDFFELCGRGLSVSEKYSLFEQVDHIVV
jgi:hypothetical protein